MRVQITTESDAAEPWIEIHAKSSDEKIIRLADELEKVSLGGAGGSEKTMVLFSAWNGDVVTILKPESIIRFYSLEKKVYAQTGDGIFQIKRYLYEIEKILSENDCRNFFRISNSEIVNFEFIKNLDMSLSGTIHINFKNGERSVVSRRFTKIICKKLQIR